MSILRRSNSAATPARLIAEASVKGPYNGKAVLHCTPGFDNADKRFTLEDLDISLPDDGILAKLAEKMINNLFNAKLDSKLEALINEKFLSLFEEIVAQLRKVTLPKGGTLHFDTQSFNLDRLTTDASGLQFVAELTVSLQWNINQRRNVEFRMPGLGEDGELSILPLHLYASTQYAAIYVSIMSLPFSPSCPGIA